MQALSRPQVPAVRPSYLERHQHDFGEALFGHSAQAIAHFLAEEGGLQSSSEASLAKQIRRHVYNAEDRKKYVSAATSYLKTKRPRLSTAYDVIIVGAGIHAATFLYTLRKEHPDLRVLIVEKSHAICDTFARLGDSLVLNSPTFSKVGLNANIVEGHFIQVSDFDELIEKPFPTAKHLHELATMILFHADADIAFGFEVESVGTVGDSYAVSSEGEVITARSVVISTGMGEPSQASFSRDQPSDKIISGDNFIASCYADTAFMDALKGKNVAVVGAGDTANCVMEYLLPLGYPNREYGFYRDVPFIPGHVYWVGQRAQGVQDFGLVNKHRYCHSGGLVEFFWEGETPFDLPTETWRTTKALITCMPDKLDALSHTPNAVKLKIGGRQFEVDVVIDCTSRANSLSAVLLQNAYAFVEGRITLYGGHWDEDLDQFVTSPLFLPTRKIACKLQDEDIFFLGSACPLRELIDDSEALDGSLRHLEHRTSLTNSKWSLEHTLPRTVALARLYGDMLAVPQRSGASSTVSVSRSRQPTY